eukprot:302872_1
MAQELRCKASGCQQRHARHYCKVCHDSDSNHRAGNCPSNSNRYQNNHNNDSNISVSKLLSEMQQLKKRLHDLEQERMKSQLMLIWVLLDMHHIKSLIYRKIFQIKPKRYWYERMSMHIIKYLNII